MQWLEKLSATRADGHDLEWLGPDAERIRKAWGPGAVLWAAEVGERVIEEAGQELPLLGGRTRSIVDALRRATMSTTLRVLAIVSGCAEPAASVVTAEAEGGHARHGTPRHDAA